MKTNHILIIVGVIIIIFIIMILSNKNVPKYKQGVGSTFPTKSCYCGGNYIGAYPRTEPCPPCTQ